MNWIFNKRLDVFCFLGLPLLGFVVNAFLETGDAASVQFLWLVTIMLDTAHIYGSFFRIYGDRELLRQRRRFYFLLPVGIVFFYVAWRLTLSRESLVTFISYLFMLHFIRQQYGWMRLSLRNTRLSNSTRKLFYVAIYVFTLVPPILLHLQPGRWWFVEDDIYQFPQLSFLIPWAHGVALIGAVGFVALCMKFRREGIEAAAIVGVSTFLCWYGGLSVVETSLPMLLLHGVPYLPLLHRFGLKNMSGEQNKILKHVYDGPLGFAGFYFVLVMIAFVLDSGRSEVLKFVAVPAALFHAITDGMVWRISNAQNRSVIETLETERFTA